MRTINHIVIHHSATPTYTTTKIIREWHMKKGWSDIGYHIIIEHGGMVEMGRSFDIPGAHVKGHNNDTLGICVVGDNTIRERKWGDNQITSLESVLDLLALSFPSATILGHRDMPDTATECPGLNVRKLLQLPAL